MQTLVQSCLVMFMLSLQSLWFISFPDIRQDVCLLLIISAGYRNDHAHHGPILLTVCITPLYVVLLCVYSAVHKSYALFSQDVLCLSYCLGH